MTKKFIIFTMGRTGSSFLCDLLNSHSEIECGYEIFKNSPTDHPEQIIEQFWNKAKSPVAGFKILEHQCDYELHKKLAASSEFRKILLIRKNPIERYVSLKLAQTTGIWHLDHQLSPHVVEKGLKDIIHMKYSLGQIKNKIVETIKKWHQKMTYRPVQLTITKDELLENFKREQKYNSLIKNSFNDDYYKIIYYEDLCMHRESVLKDLCRFLGIHFEEMLSSRSKIDHHHLSERIANYSQLVSELNGTELAKFL